jgi:hypothetical protein
MKKMINFFNNNTIIEDIIFLILDLLKNKMCENNYNDDDIKTFITNNLNKDIIKE